MPDSTAGAARDLTLPPWVWPLALVVGVGIAAGSLSYHPAGRLNILWLWLLWAGLPFMGALASLGFLLFGRDRPWLFRTPRQRLHWYPNRVQRWQMLWLLQLFWLWLGLGMLLGFAVLLLLTDLSFGWSSTLIEGGQVPLLWLQAIAYPWSALWPAAVPDAALLEATRYWRIDPESTGIERAGDWWPFLMASLLCYNLLPRALLAGVSAARYRQLRRAQQGPQVRGPSLDKTRENTTEPLREAFQGDWEHASCLDWELDGESLGRGQWQDDERVVDAIVAGSPAQLLWRVPASRSPVGELADLVDRARRAGVPEQGLRVLTDTQTQAERHLASWRRFAEQQALTWVTQ